MGTFRHLCAHTSLVCALTALMLCAGGLPATAAISAGVSALDATQMGFRQVHDTVAPAIVSINSKVVEEREGRRGDNPLDLFGQPRGPQTSNATGSGVIIRPEGIILTNSHVVQNATEVTVQVPGYEKPIPAEVVQADPRTDLAIVRLKQRGTYPVASLGDASTVQVGDWAIAFGSPFKLSSTMTVGVISATGRKLRSPGEDYTFRDLLQTDASINPGNSGGPLVNIRGEVIGINFMIYSPGDSTGSVGIGFAIPINTDTKQIINTLVSGRAVERGRLGINVLNLDNTMRDAYGVSTDNGGILIDSVVPGLAADKAGLQSEDVIVEYNGSRVSDIDQFTSLVERTQPGTVVAVTIVRNQKVSRINVTIAEASKPNRSRATERRIGMSVETITPQIAAQFRLPATSGVIITEVVPGSPADDAQLRTGDIIIRVGLDQIASAEDFWTTLSKVTASEKSGVILRVRRGPYETTKSLEFPSAE